MRYEKLIIATSLVASLLASTIAQAKGGLGEVFGGLIGKAVGGTAGKAVASPESVEAALRKMSEQLNASMPMTIDKDTRLDNIFAGPGARFTYNYTIITAKSVQVNRAALLQHLQSNLRAGVCSNPDMQIFFKNNVTVGYSYRASDGVFVARIDIAPRDCGYAA